MLIRRVIECFACLRRVGHVVPQQGGRALRGRQRILIVEDDAGLTPAVLSGWSDGAVVFALAAKEGSPARVKYDPTLVDPTRAISPFLRSPIIVILSFFEIAAVADSGSTPPASPSRSVLPSPPLTRRGKRTAASAALSKTGGDKGPVSKNQSMSIEAGWRMFVPPFFQEVAQALGLCLSQLTPNTFSIMAGFEFVCRSRGLACTAERLLALYNEEGYFQMKYNMLKLAKIPRLFQLCGLQGETRSVHFPHLDKDPEFCALVSSLAEVVSDKVAPKVLKGSRSTRGSVSLSRSGIATRSGDPSPHSVSEVFLEVNSGLPSFGDFQSLQEDDLEVFHNPAPLAPKPASNFEWIRESLPSCFDLSCLLVPLRGLEVESISHASPPRAPSRARFNPIEKEAGPSLVVEGGGKTDASASSPTSREGLVGPIEGLSGEVDGGSLAVSSVPKEGAVPRLEDVVLSGLLERSRLEEIPEAQINGAGGQVEPCEEGTSSQAVVDKVVHLGSVELPLVEELRGVGSSFAQLRQVVDPREVESLRNRGLQWLKDTTCYAAVDFNSPQFLLMEHIQTLDDRVAELEASALGSLVQELEELKLDHSRVTAELREVRVAFEARAKRCLEWEAHATQLAKEKGFVLERLRAVEGERDDSAAELAALKDALDKTSRLRLEAEAGCTEAMKTVESLRDELRDCQASIDQRIAEQVRRVGTDLREQFSEKAKRDAYERIIQYIGSPLHHGFFRKVVIPEASSLASRSSSPDSRARRIRAMGSEIMAGGPMLTGPGPPSTRAADALFPRPADVFSRAVSTVAASGASAVASSLEERLIRVIPARVMPVRAHVGVEVVTVCVILPEKLLRLVEPLRLASWRKIPVVDSYTSVPPSAVQLANGVASRFDHDSRGVASRTRRGTESQLAAAVRNRRAAAGEVPPTDTKVAAAFDNRDPYYNPAEGFQLVIRDLESDQMVGQGRAGSTPSSQMEESVRELLDQYGIVGLDVLVPNPSEHAFNPPAGYLTVYSEQIHNGLRCFFHPFISHVLSFMQICPSQLVPHSYRCLVGYVLLYNYLNIPMSPALLFGAFAPRPVRQGYPFFQLVARQSVNFFLSGISMAFPSYRNWRTASSLFALVADSGDRGFFSTTYNAVSILERPRALIMVGLQAGSDHVNLIGAPLRRGTPFGAELATHELGNSSAEAVQEISSGDESPSCDGNVTPRRRHVSPTGPFGPLFSGSGMARTSPLSSPTLGVSVTPPGRTFSIDDYLRSFSEDRSGEEIPTGATPVDPVASSISSVSTPVAPSGEGTSSAPFQRQDLRAMYSSGRMNGLRDLVDSLLNPEERRLLSQDDGVQLLEVADKYTAELEEMKASWGKESFRLRGEVDALKKAAARERLLQEQVDNLQEMDKEARGTGGFVAGGSGPKGCPERRTGAGRGSSGRGRGGFDLVILPFEITRQTRVESLCVRDRTPTSAAAAATPAAVAATPLVPPRESRSPPVKEVREVSEEERRAAVRAGKRRLDDH
uniref:Uncharacterized protein n=1 Tax=Antirrhinum hispanicum TaxID=49039 RepID=Q9AXC2_ANTHI|nr:hypothetical protein [Antirrhinum hispanicum]